MKQSELNDLERMAVAWFRQLSRYEQWLVFRALDGDDAARETMPDYLHKRLLQLAQIFDEQ